MIRNYVLIAWRNIIRNSSVSLMNIIGLSIGLTCTLFIFLWVQSELSFDRFHKDVNRIYRVEEDQHYSNGIYHVNVTPWPSGPVWKEKIPELEQSCRMTGTGSLLLTRNDISFYENNIQAVDSTFFDIFSFDLISGNPETVLKDPGSVVISHEMALKYFGKEDPIGKTILINNKDLFEVTGIFTKMPSNSSFNYDFLLPFDYLKDAGYGIDCWGCNSIFTYVKIKENADIVEIGKKLTAIVKENNPYNETDFLLAPLTGIHLHTYWGLGHNPGAVLNVWIFGSVAILVLIIACINFMNLSTARSLTRAKEIGLRRVNGAHKWNLIIQFLSESMITTLISATIATFAVILLLVPFNGLSGKDFHVINLLSPVCITGLIVIVLSTGIFAGLYPAFILSGFKPVQSLKGKLVKGRNGGTFTKATVALQFVLSIVLIAGTIVIYRQMKFMRNQNMGYDKENLLYIDLRGDMSKSYDMIKEELLREPVVKSVSAAITPPHMIGNNSSDAYWEGKSKEDDILISTTRVDFDFIETMDIEMKSGRQFLKNFTSDIPHDTVKSFIINEEMEKLMGMKDVVGAQLRFNGTGPVIGVMKNFNFKTLHSKIEPLAISIVPDKSELNFIYIRLNAGNLEYNLKQLEKAWSHIMPAYPFSAHFVDDELEQSYRSEIRMGNLMNYFAVLAIIIACIGLYGLATHAVERRMREMGIRKALGSPSISIFTHYTREFAQMLAIAIVISIPVAWYLFKRFLQNYSYRIEIDYGIFVISILITIAVAMLAISYQAMKAIHSDPAEILKYE